MKLRGANILETIIILWLIFSTVSFAIHSSFLLSFQLSLSISICNPLLILIFPSSAILLIIYIGCPTPTSTSSGPSNVPTIQPTWCPTTASSATYKNASSPTRSPTAAASTIPTMSSTSISSTRTRTVTVGSFRVPGPEEVRAVRWRLGCRWRAQHVQPTQRGEVRSLAFHLLQLLHQ